VSERRPEPFLLSFERAPVWLLALEPSVCSAVFFVGVKSAKELLGVLESRSEDPTLFNRAVARIGVSRVHYCGQKPPPDDAIMLVSGSYPFLQRAASKPGLERKIFLLDEPWRRTIKPNPSYGFTWKILTPSQFGGSTDFPVLVGFSGFPFTLRGSSLARNIGHILDHSIRPVPLAASEVESLGHLDFYVSDSLLDPRFLERPVAYQTSYSSSQWGSRLLTAEEIGISFGLPGRLRVGGLTTAMFPFVPVQVLAGCLDSLGKVTGRLFQPLSTPGPKVLAPVPTFTWLPSIGQRLDHSWIDQSAVSSKAAKCDDARVMTHMWDRRVVLPLPGTQEGLPFLRSRLLRFQRSRLYAEFRCHMRDTHGPDWLGQLKLIRTTMRLNRGKGPNGHTGGFRKKKNTSNKSESGFMGSSSGRPVPTSAAT
jgi:hypothetical protein